MKEFDLDTSVWDLVVDLFYSGLYVYSIVIMAAYLLLALLSFRSVKIYLHQTNFIDYKDILNTPIAPGISLVAPAYNESATISENIRSLMSLHYSKYEVIIVNDGSKDDTLEKVIEEYSLVKVDYCVNPQLNTKPIRGIYKSTNKSWNNLIVVDKENGGKSDALNCGINVSNNDYVTCIDVDCILEQDSLLKLMKPFTDETDAEIIATGGVIRIANSCEVKDGRLVKVNIPKNFVARTQALEYIRAFLLGRMAWSLLDGLILISGALGVFKKKLVIEVGGYDHSTVGEDMELVVRMRRYMRNNDRKYKVAYVPDPLCWTECPESWGLLGRQRNRWTRGTIETLLRHKKMFLNPKHGLIGMLSYPYWFFFEWLAPLLEAFGMMLFFLMALFGLVNWSFFFLMMFLVYGFTLCFSVLSLLIEEITYHNYKKHGEIFKLLLVGILEPLAFHPFVVYHAVKGNIDYVLGKSAWGDMARKGFAYGSRSGGKKIRVVNSTIASSTTSMKKAKWVTRVVGVVGVAAVITVAYFVYKGIEKESFPKPQIVDKAKVYTIDKFDEQERSRLVLLDNEDESPRNPDAVNPESTKPDSSFDKEKEVENAVDSDEIEPETIEEEEPIIQPKVKEEPKKVIEKPKAKPATPQKFYFIIAGSFTDKENAQKLVTKLQADGFADAQYIQSKPDQFRVSYGKFETKEQAYNYRESLLQQGKAEGSWVFGHLE